VNLAPVPARRSPIRNGRSAAFLAILICAWLAACSTPTPATTPLANATGPAPTDTPLPPTSFGPPPSPTQPDDATPLALDPTLLALLPATVSGIAVTEDPDAAAQALGNQALPAIATALDAAVAVDTGNGNLVSALVVRIRPSVFVDESFRQWRDSWDQGACADGGGVIGNAEATLGGRQTFITSCASGTHTYHVFLKAQGVVISATAFGPGRFGELLLTNLRVPS
jgi:hypothetical protein